MAAIPFLYYTQIYGLQHKRDLTWRYDKSAYIMNWKFEISVYYSLDTCNFL